MMMDDDEWWWWCWWWCWQFGVFSPKRSLFQGWRLGDRQNHKRLCFHTQVLHTEVFTHKSIYTEKSLHKVILHTRDFTHRSFYTEKLLHREVSTQSRGKENLHFTSRLCFRYTRSPQRFAPAQTMQIRVGDAQSPQKVAFLISFDGRTLAASAAKREKFRKTWEAGVL